LSAQLTNEKGLKVERAYVPLIYGLRDPDRYLYHYTKAETALTHILPMNRLKLGRFENTNDPRETRRWHFSSHSPTSAVDLAKYDLDELSEVVGGTLQQCARLVCFSRDTGPMTGDHLKDVHRRGLALPRMWHFYGDAHRGVCLVLDRMKLIQALEIAARATTGAAYYCHGPLRYALHPLAGPAGAGEFVVDVEEMERLGAAHYVLSHLHTHLARLFFAKALDWLSEAEWRAVLFVKSSDECYVSIEEALVGVIHGDAVPAAVSEAIIRASDRPMVEHMGLYWPNGSPWYDLGRGAWSYANRRLFERCEGTWSIPERRP
jgi:hypothetical protein